MRSYRLLLALAAALLLAGLLPSVPLPAAATVAAAAEPAGCEAVARLRVPADCPTIQAALDAVDENGEVDVLSGTYSENLVIRKSLTLSGGFDEAYQEPAGVSTIDAAHRGRGITISNDEAVVVAISDLSVINGVASGLGGITASAALEIEEGYRGAGIPAGAPFQVKEGDDCGGGIYVRNANVSLTQVEVKDNVASATGRGFGGGICAVDLPNSEDELDGLKLAEGCKISGNVASSAAGGAGGGIFAANARAGVRLLNSAVSGNAASLSHSGYGGGVFGAHLSTYFQGVSEITGNTASKASDPAAYGRGGGVAIVAADDTLVSSSHVQGNVAATATRGYGGGLYMTGAGNGIELRETEYEGNHASAAAAGAGYGGGLFIESPVAREKLYVRVNDLHDNVAAAGGQGAGGGAFIVDAPEIMFLLNKVNANMAIATAGTGEAFGGGAAIVDSAHPLVEMNQFNNNVVAGAAAAGATAVARGGGIFINHADGMPFDTNVVRGNQTGIGLAGEGGGAYIEESASGEAPVRILDNTFDGNSASQGGGLAVRNTGEALIRHNRFTGNTATGAAAPGFDAGGGLYVHQPAAATLPVTVDRNFFLRNTAGPLATKGGGAAIVDAGDLVLANNVFGGNSGTAAAGLYLSARASGQNSSAAANNTFEANNGPAAGIQGWSDPPFALSNNIISNSPVGVDVAAGSSAVIDYTLWSNVPARTSGAGTAQDLHPATGDPVFVNAAKDDYHLQMASAARDAGDPAGIPPAPDVDLASAIRPFGPRVDAGAYEWRDNVHFPNDYATLQEAIDAARSGDGDTILAAGFGYGATEEQIRVTKSITLSGGWDPKFEKRASQAPTYWLNQPGTKGRFLTIEGGPDVAVTVEGFSFSYGDASGLGGVETGGALGVPQSVRGSEPAAGASLSGNAPAPSPSAVRDVISQLGAGGRTTDLLVTAGKMLDRLDEVARQDPGDAAGSAARPSEDEIDCGGAILSKGAALRLHEDYFQRSYASKEGDGLGGAVCVLGAPAGGLAIQDVEMRYNTASFSGNGAGGALFISGAERAELSGLNLYLNVGSARGPNGTGGAMWASGAPGLKLKDSVFDGNIAAGTWGALGGSGGGAEIWQSGGAEIADNIFRSNLGGPVCLTCRGGALNIADTSQIKITGNTFKDNIAGLSEWTTGVTGGGLALDAVRNSDVMSNTFTSNTAGLAGVEMNAGGGIYGIALDDVRFVGNLLEGNAASQVGSGHGGGAFFQPSSRAPSHNLLFRNNRFAGNMASFSGSAAIMAGGGGLELLSTTHTTVQGNVFDGNRVGAEMPGTGGGLLLRHRDGELGGGLLTIESTVDGNLFKGNAADQGDSMGGGLAAVGVDRYTIVNNVFAGNLAGAGGGIGLFIPRSVTGQPVDATVANNTFYANTGSGIFLYGENETPFPITNTIMVSQTLGVSAAEGTHAVLSYTLWNDVENVTDQPETVENLHPITGPVRFVNAGAGDFRLAVGSAARDAGDPAGVPPAPDHDADGTARPFGPRVDAGAYEWHGRANFLPWLTR